MKKSAIVFMALVLPALSLGTLVWTSLHPQKRLPAADETVPAEKEKILADKIFFDKQTHPLLDLPAQFMRGDLKEWREWAQQNKMPYLNFKSTQNEQYRTIFLDQGKDYDRWFLGVAKMNDIENGDGSYRREQDKDKAKLLAVLVMDKTTTVPKIFFREYKVKEGQIELADDAESCYSCHASGVREIRGVSETESPMIAGLDPINLTPAAVGAKRLSDFNNLLASYPLPDWHGSYEPEKWYPALGKNSTSKFSCYQCHDGSDRGILTPLSNAEELKRKVIDEASMPPKFKGNRAQRTKLWNELAGPGYKKAIEKWLKSRPADNYDRREMPPFFGEGDPEH